MIAVKSSALRTAMGVHAFISSLAITARQSRRRPKRVDTLSEGTPSDAPCRTATSTGALCAHAPARRTGSFLGRISSRRLSAKIEAAIMRSTGTVAGFPDLFFVKAGQLYALELKSAIGRLSPAQIETHQRMRQAGAIVETVYDIDAALDQIGRWQLLRPDRAEASAAPSAHNEE